MPEIFLRSQTDEQFEVGNQGVRGEFIAVEGNMSVMELLFQFYDPGFLPTVVTLHFLVGEDWLEQKALVNEMVLTVSKKNGFLKKENGAFEIEYGETLETLYRFLLLLQKNEQP